MSSCATNLETSSFVFTSTPNDSPQESLEEMQEVVQSISQVIDGCIKSGQEVLKQWHQSRPERFEQSPILQQIIDRIKNDTESIVLLKECVKKLRDSLQSKEGNAIKKNLSTMMNNIDNISEAKLKMIADVICLTQASNVKQKFEATDKDLDAFEKSGNLDGATKKLVHLLIEQNRKVLACLKYAYGLLPTMLSGEDSRKFQKISSAIQLVVDQSDGPKTLFILGENLNRTFRHQPTDLELIGKVTIEEQIAGVSPKNGARSPRSPQNRRKWLNGMLQDGNGIMEDVVLELTEPMGDLIDFSGDAAGLNRTLVAKIERNGEEVDQSLLVVEVDVADVFEGNSPKAIATVQDDRTGQVQDMEVQIVPTQVNETIRGTILELKSANLPNAATECQLQMSTPKRGQSKHKFRQTVNLIRNLRHLRETAALKRNNASLPQASQEPEQTVCEQPRKTLRERLMSEPAERTQNPAPENLQRIFVQPKIPSAATQAHYNQLLKSNKHRLLKSSPSKIYATVETPKRFDIDFAPSATRFDNVARQKRNIAKNAIIERLNKSLNDSYIERLRDEDERLGKTPAETKRNLLKHRLNAVKAQVKQDLSKSDSLQGIFNGPQRTNNSSKIVKETLDRLDMPPPRAPPRRAKGPSVKKSKNNRAVVEDSQAAINNYIRNMIMQNVMELSKTPVQSPMNVTPEELDESPVCQLRNRNEFTSIATEDFELDERLSDITAPDFEDFDDDEQDAEEALTDYEPVNGERSETSLDDEVFNDESDDELIAEVDIDQELYYT